MWALTDCFISFAYPIATFYVGADGLLHFIRLSYRHILCGR